VKFSAAPGTAIPYVVLGAPDHPIDELKGKSHRCVVARETPPDMVAKAALAMFKNSMPTCVRRRRRRSRAL